MNKTEVLQKLNELKNECEIAEIICTIKDIYRNISFRQSIIVILVSEPSYDDQISPCRHWMTYDGIEDFENAVVYGNAEAKEMYSNYYVEDFKEVKPFISDFA